MTFDVDEPLPLPFGDAGKQDKLLNSLAKLAADLGNLTGRNAAFPSIATDIEAIRNSMAKLAADLGDLTDRNGAFPSIAADLQAIRNSTAALTTSVNNLSQAIIAALDQKNLNSITCLLGEIKACICKNAKPAQSTAK
jgi:hypothetical protein